MRFAVAALVGIVVNLALIACVHVDRAPLSNRARPPVTFQRAPQDLTLLTSDPSLSGAYALDLGYHPAVTRYRNLRICDGLTAIPAFACFDGSVPMYDGCQWTCTAAWARVFRP